MWIRKQKGNGEFTRTIAMTEKATSGTYHWFFEAQDFSNAYSDTIKKVLVVLGGTSGESTDYRDLPGGGFSRKYSFNSWKSYSEAARKGPKSVKRPS